MKFDIVLFLSVLILSIIGILLIYSAVVDTPLRTLYLRQSAFLLLAFGSMFLISRIPLRVHDGLAYIYYIVILLMLIVVMLQRGNVHRWLVLGPIRLQPSEFSKLAMIFVLGRWLRDHIREINSFKVILGSFLIMLPPFILVIMEPDLGSGIIFLVILFIMLLAGGARFVLILLLLNPLIAMIAAFNKIAWVAYFILLIATLIKYKTRFAMFFVTVTIAIIMGSATPYVWAKLHPYQRQRIKVFFNPTHDPFGAGYQLIQSKIAIGAGGLTGKGFMKGTQTRLQFLPAKHSDFIFAVLGEQFGFIGSIIIIFLYWLIIWRGLTIAKNSRTQFSWMVSLAIVGMLTFQVFINIAMTVGFAPITGIPLPFLSSGGSSLVVFWSAVGILMSIYSQRIEQ